MLLSKLNNSFTFLRFLLFSDKHFLYISFIKLKLSLLIYTNTSSAFNIPISSITPISNADLGIKILDFFNKSSKNKFYLTIN